ncbi:MAG: hypothetical protein RJA20_364 [Bacteroidota bacterium]|jgi:hypothetical protein
MNSSIFPNIWRFLGLILGQGLLLKQVVQTVGSAWFNIMLYPIFILLLPVQLAAPYLVLLGFAVGISVDMFYQTPGVHASTGAFAGFIRGMIFTAFAPKGGFNAKDPIFAPHYVSWQTFLSVSGVFFFLYLFWYYSVEAFTFVYFTSIVLKTLSTWSITMIFVILYAALFNPKQ